MSRFHPRSQAEDEARGAFKDRGAHTLDVLVGVIVGVYGDDVFVELENLDADGDDVDSLEAEHSQEAGPKKQGLIDRRAFQRDPVRGEVYEFTQRGREDELWILNLVDEETLEQWEDLEEGSLLSARVTQKTHDGFQVKIGQLHAYMPFSVSGVRRSRDRGALVGRSVVVLVLSVDDDKQRAVVSRKAVLKMQQEGQSPGAVVPGQVVTGRVSRVEPYGAFIRFGRGKEGLCHVSNLSIDRVEDPSQVVSVGEAVEARVLYVRNGGKRIGLGLRQMHESPWLRIEREHWEGQIVPVEITRVGTFGAIARLAPGVEGILPMVELGGARPNHGIRAGDRVSARILELDPEIERIAFSLLHFGGGRIEPDEAETLAAFERDRGDPAIESVLGGVGAAGEGEPRTGGDPDAPRSAATNLGDLLRRALEHGESR